MEKKQSIQIFESKDKEFVLSKSFILVTLTVLILAVLSILCICGLSKDILGIFVKVFNFIESLHVLILLLIVLACIGLKVLTDYLKGKKLNKQISEERKKKYLIKLGVIGGIIVILTALGLFHWIAMFVRLSLRLYKVSIYGSWIFIIVTYLVQDAIAADFAEKKGYTRFIGALWGLIPFYGMIRFAVAPKRRNVQNTTLRGIYAGKEVFIKYMLFLELTLLSLIVVLPIVYLVGASLSNLSQLPTTFWPSKEIFTFDNYVNLFTKTKYPVWFKNTFIIACINMVCGVLFITGAGYVFARYKFKGKKVGLITILVLQVFPSFMGMVALFTLYETFGLVGHPIALSIIYIGGSIPGNLWLIKGNMSTIPKDLDESAMLDGANKLQIFTYIILPLSVPILSFVAVNLFMSPWMDYILPSYLLNILPKSKQNLITDTVSADDLIKEQWTLAVGIYDMINDAKDSNYTQFAAGSIIIALPITILYVCFQRFLIEGITAGATKG